MEVEREEETREEEERVLAKMSGGAGSPQSSADPPLLELRCGRVPVR